MTTKVKVTLTLVMILTALSFQTICFAKTYKVIRVDDGDTVELENHEIIRFIGVDTPETHHPKKPPQYYGKQATRFVTERILNKQVRVEYDPVNKDNGNKGYYGRTLAYLWYVPEGEEQEVNLSGELIKYGYGYLYTKYGSFKYIDEFRGQEQQAREAGYGLWQQTVHNSEIKHLIEVYEGLPQAQQDKMVGFGQKLTSN